MSSRTSGVLLNSILGMALVTVAGVNILLLGGIGWTAWERAGLGERWADLRQALPAGWDEAGLLSEQTGSAESGTLAARRGLVSDAVIARYIAALRAEAAACGATVINLSAQPAPAGILPRRIFLFKAEGSAPQLLSLLKWVAQTAPWPARIEDVSLLVEGGRAELSLRLLIAVQESEP
jgi:hypothetical protein